MKRLFVILLTLSLVLSLAACGENADKPAPYAKVTDTPAPEATAVPTEEPDGTEEITDADLKLAWAVGASAVDGGFDTVMDRGTYDLLGKTCKLFYYVKDTHFVGESCVAPDGTVYVDLTGQLDWMLAEKNADGTYRLTALAADTPAPVVTATPAPTDAPEDPEEEKEDEEPEATEFIPAPTPDIPSAGSYVWPVEGFNIITYRFGEGSGHSGVDIAGADIAGAPVCAIADGVVDIVAMDEESFGLYVTIVHENEDVRFTLYAQLDSVDVEPGDYVSAGETIGHVGMSGNATGYHLHLAAYATDEWSSNFDPLALYPGVDIIVWDE